MSLCLSQDLTGSTEAARKLPEMRVPGRVDKMAPGRMCWRNSQGAAVSSAQWVRGGVEELS